MRHPVVLFALVCFVMVFLALGGAPAGADEGAAAVLAAARKARDLGTLTNDEKSVDGAASAQAFYRFSTSRTSMLTISLPTAAGLELYDRHGELVERTPAKTGTATTMARGIHAGLYYLAVRPAGGATSATKLKIKVDNLAEFGHFAIAFDMPATLSTTVFADRFPKEPATSYKWAHFLLSEAGDLKIDMYSYDSRVSLDMAVFRDGEEIGKQTTENGIATFRKEVEAGEFYVRVSNGGHGDVQFRIDVRMMSLGEKRPASEGGAPSAGPRDPRFDGTVLGNYGTWTVGKRTTGGNTRCFAYTVATAIEPRAWRRVKPTLYFEVGEKATGVVHHLDKIGAYDLGKRVSAIVDVDGKPTPIPIVRYTKTTPDWRTLQRCGKDNKNWCVSGFGLRALSVGSRLDISGFSKKGEATRVTYTLDGYADALTRMTNACSARTQWLVKRR